MSSIAQRIASLGLYDPDATAWVLAVRTAGASVSQARARHISTLINALKAANVWNSLDRLWVHAAENATQALIDLKARATATAVNSPTFAANSGYQCNGTSSYLNLGLAANAGSINYTRDDASVGGWITSVTGSGGGVDFGHDFGGYSMIIAKAGVANTRWEINANTNPSGVPSIAFVAGLFHSQRTGSATSALFRNGASIITSTAPSIALSAKNFGVGAYVAGGPSNFNAGLYAASFIGGSLSGKESAFYNAMRTLMTAVGVP